MKKALIVTAIIITALFTLAESGILDSLVIFLLSGQVPGTKYAVPSSFMLLAIISMLWLILFRFAGVELSRVVSVKKAEKRTTDRKKRMPKRRYAQILSLR